VWALKIFIKLIISRLPVPYRIWRLIGLFRHGSMDSLEYSIKIFNLHETRAFPNGIPQGSVILEIGPGDSVSSAIIGLAKNAKLTYLVDVGDFAIKDVRFYSAIRDRLERKGWLVPNLSEIKSFEDILSACNTYYLTQGLASLKSIPSGSVDFVWSHSVLEHVRKHELQSFFRELHRIMKPGGLSSHNIDYQDHLNFGLNNLRFSEKVWESSFFARSGFYTNRVPAPQLHEMFKSAGFKVVYEEFGKWPALPIRRSLLDDEFKILRDEHLINRTSSVLLKV
jgi:SAM-dependent methyltransferase